MISACEAEGKGRGQHLNVALPNLAMLRVLSCVLQRIAFTVIVCWKQAVPVALMELHCGAFFGYVWFKIDIKRKNTPFAVTAVVALDHSTLFFRSTFALPLIFHSLFFLSPSSFTEGWLVNTFPGPSTKISRYPTNEIISLVFFLSPQIIVPFPRLTTVPFNFFSVRLYSSQRAPSYRITAVSTMDLNWCICGKATVWPQLHTQQIYWDAEHTIYASTGSFKILL